MDKDKKILEYADYYLNHDVSMKTAAENFGISKKNFQLCMKKLEEISSEKYKLVQEKKSRNLFLGTIKGGQNGKPYTHIERPNDFIPNKPHTLTEQESKELARHIIDRDLTLRDAEKIFGVAKSTISDNLNKEILGEELYSEFSSFMETHKPGNRKKC